MSALDQFRPIPMLRNSERGTFKTCQQQWFWGWELELVPAMTKQDARWFGTCWHVAWAEYYTPPLNNGVRAGGFTRGRDPHETWDEQMKHTWNAKIATGDWGDPNQEQEWVDAKELGHLMIDGQLDMWKGDPGWEVLMPEQRFRAKIPFNDRQMRLPLSHWTRLGLDTRQPIVEIVGTFDLPIRDHNANGQIKIVDWKSAAAYDAVSAWLTKDDQVGTYIAISTAFLRKAELIKPNEAVSGGIWSYARKQKPDTRPRNELGQCLNKDGSVSKKQPLPLFWREEVLRNTGNRQRQLVRIADDAEQIAAARAGVIGITKNPGKHCNWCDFKDLCDVDENGGDVEQYMKDVFKTDDKYSDHRPGAKNSKVSN